VEAKRMTTTTKILLSNNPDALQAALAAYKYSATVEAEYGDRLVVGSAVTMAHHGARAGNPAPCLSNNWDGSTLEAIGLSHVDLDAIGGVAALLGKKPGAHTFWQLAAFIDVNGAHKLGDSGAAVADIDRLYAWWAWNEAHKVYPPRDGTVADVTVDVHRAITALRLITEDYDKMIAAGWAFRSAEAKLNEESYVGSVAHGDVLLRVSPQFTNHLYATPGGAVAKAVVAYNTLVGSVTISLADPIPGISCGEIVKKLWGDLAGGHAGIAGSPRGTRMELTAMVNAAMALGALMQGPS
jgi:hypothetical protein